MKFKIGDRVIYTMDFNKMYGINRVYSYKGYIKAYSGKEDIMYGPYELSFDGKACSVKEEDLELDHEYYAKIRDNKLIELGI
jgi:hypothetical protein